MQVVRAAAGKFSEQEMYKQVTSEESRLSAPDLAFCCRLTDIASYLTQQCWHLLKVSNFVIR